MPSPAVITHLSVNALPKVLAADVHNNIERNPPFKCFASFLICLLIPFINNPNSSFNYFH